MKTEKPKLSQKDRAAAYVRKMDAAIEGAGGDNQTFCVACKLVEFGLSASDCLDVMKEYNTRCQPEWSEAELARKVAYAFKHATVNPEFCDSKTPVSRELPEIKSLHRWPVVNAAHRSEVVTFGIGLSDLNDLSPVSFELPATQHILRTLFPDDPLICIGQSSDRFWTNRLSSFGNKVEFVQLIVPSPMSKLKGKILAPKPGGPVESAHTKDNTGPRKYAVIEFDKGSSDDHAAILWHLTKWAPLVMAVHSGGKSLHGWFYVGGSPDERVLRFYRYAVSLGADRATFTKSQFVRMPDGRRDNGKRQAVHYFNPSILP